MSQSPISLSPDMKRFVEERQQIRQTYTNSLEQAEKFGELAAQVQAYHVEPNLIPPMQVEANAATPADVVMGILPRIEQEIAVVRRIEQQIQNEQGAISDIQRNAQNLKTALIVGGVVAVLIVILLILVVAHVI
jgi:CHASE3 domain sensor protein